MEVKFPSNTDAVLGGQFPSPFQGVVLGGKKETLARIETCPEVAISETFSEQVLLPKLCRYFFENASPLQCISKVSRKKIISLHFENFILHANKKDDYGNLIKVCCKGKQVGTLFHPGLLFGDRIIFAPFPLLGDRAEESHWQQICQLVLRAAIAIYNGQESTVLQTPPSVNSWHWWITTNCGLTVQVEAENWKTACRLAANIALVYYGKNFLDSVNLIKIDCQTTEGRVTIAKESGDYLLSEIPGHKECIKKGAIFLVDETLKNKAYGVF